MEFNPQFNRNLFFIKEHTGLFKASNNFDIYDPETQQQILLCREENLSFFNKFFRFTDLKRSMPFSIEVRTTDGKTLMTISRKFTWFLSTVEVTDARGTVLGKFKQKFFSIGGKFELLDASERKLCTLKGNWTSWEFTFVSSENREFARISKKWSGFAKEMFTTADNYVLSIQPEVPADHPLRMLILAAVLCIDLVLKE